LNTLRCICHGENAGRSLRNLAVETVVTEWRSGVIKCLNIIARLAWIGTSFHFIGIDLNLFVAPAMPAPNVAKIPPAERYIPTARIAAGTLTR
jgi:hypothetical protein